MNFLKELTITLLYSTGLRKKRVDESANLNEDNETIFNDVYLHHKWGKNPLDQYSSGLGTYSKCSEAYSKLVSDFIREKKLITVHEIGCGNFHVTNDILFRLKQHNYPIEYLGTDVSSVIINTNKSRFAEVNFKQMDACNEVLPGGDLLLIRQVFQHLSNSAIKKIIQLNFHKYDSIIVTEHHPLKILTLKANKDKISGAFFRVGHGSGVFLNEKPFNLKWKMLLSCKPKNELGKINTFSIVK